MAKKPVIDDVPIKARVLARHHVDGKLYLPDGVVSASPSAIKELESQGLVDSDEEAVAYAESLV